MPTKHLNNHTSWIRAMVDQGYIEPRFCRTQVNCADMLTKPLPREAFERFASEISGRAPVRLRLEDTLAQHEAAEEKID